MEKSSNAGILRSGKKSLCKVWDVKYMMRRVIHLLTMPRNSVKPYIKDIKLDKMDMERLVGAFRRSQKVVVALSFKYNAFFFLFLACHLFAHENILLERNLQYRIICQTLFKQTYKLDIGTSDYNTSAKERVTSWTDKILYKECRLLSSIRQDRMPIKPVTL